MEPHPSKESIILRVMLSALLFSLFLKMTTLLRLVDVFIAWDWSAIPVMLAIVLARLLFAAVVVLTILPLILMLKSPRDWLPGYLRIDLKCVLLGIFSFVIFCVVAAAISLGMGIFDGDLSVVLARPDIQPEPDVVGWGYFFLALVPGIWEELAFRGLVQSKFREAFPTTVSILLSATFFGLYHFSNMLTQPLSLVIGGVIMAFFFGIAWGAMTIRAGSVIPAILSHYLVDSLGQVLLNVDGSNPGLATGFFLLLTFTFPALNIILAKVMYRETTSMPEQPEMSR
jgi:membrane protease YdiL (CAAX protease family)